MSQVRIDTHALNQLNRALIGFDQIFNNFENRLAGQISQNYPPFNVVQVTENEYEIQVAVAGFKKSEIDVEINQNQLLVSGKKAIVESDERVYLHRGLAARDFEREWTLEQYIEVRGAEIQDGILTIKLERVLPESMKPRKIEIAETIEVKPRLSTAA